MKEFKTKHNTLGYTSFTKELVGNIIKEYRPEGVVDLGSENDFSGPNLPAPYISEWYKSMGIDYYCIDLNGENNAYQLDLGVLLPKDFLNFHSGDFYMTRCRHLVLDVGTSEHVGREGSFNWEAIYNCWKNKFDLCRIDGGIIYSENPLSGFWPLHGWNYYTTKFYHELEACSGLRLLKWGTVCAMGNCETGQNAWAVQKKVGDEFPSLEVFKTLSIKQS